MAKVMQTGCGCPNPIVGVGGTPNTEDAAASPLKTMCETSIASNCLDFIELGVLDCGGLLQKREEHILTDLLHRTLKDVRTVKDVQGGGDTIVVEFYSKVC